MLLIQQKQTIQGMEKFPKDHGNYPYRIHKKLSNKTACFIKNRLFLCFCKIATSFCKKTTQIFFHILTSPYLYNRKYQTL